MRPSPIRVQELSARNTVTSQTPPSPHADFIVEGEYHHGRAGAALHRNQRRHRRGQRAGGDRLGLAAVPLLRPPRCSRWRSPWPMPTSPRHPGRNRRSLRRQGRIPLDHRRSRGFVGVEIRPARKDDLRPRRRHGRDHQAAPLPHAPPHGRLSRRQTLGLEIDFVIDGGAYATLVCTRWCYRAAPSTRPDPTSGPHVRVRSKAVATNTPPARRVSRFRRAAEPLRARAPHGQDRPRPRPDARRAAPPQLLARRRHDGHRPDHPPSRVDIDGLLTRALEASPATTLRKPSEFCARVQSSRRPVIKRGIGFATFHARRRFYRLRRALRLNSLVGISKAPREGKHPQILVSSTEFGQGTNTILAQVAAETLNAAVRFDIEIARRTRHLVPNSGPTVASRTAMIVGQASSSAPATRHARHPAPKPAYCRQTHTARRSRTRAIQAYVAQHGELKCLPALRSSRRNIFWDDDQNTRATPTPPMPGPSTSPR